MNFLKKIIIYNFLFLCLSITGYSQEDNTIVIVENEFIDTSYFISQPVPIDSLIRIGKTYLGLPYRTTIRAPWPLDCSGYVSMLYGFFGVNLPHSSGGIAEKTKTISLSEVQPGDMLFFKGRDRYRNRVGHVALVIEVHDDYVLMMHSTNSKGIIIEQYPDTYYYKQRFIKAGRL